MPHPTSPAAHAPAGLWHKLPVWGRVGTEAFERFSDDLARAAQDVPLSRGLGRSYGDSSLPPAGRPQALNTTLADRILDFDEQTGLLRAESGLSLYDLNWTLLPRGWFVPVTPGTQFVTIGGMIAADVHGKNHHVEGTFGKHVTWMKLKTADGRVVECSRQREADLFLATIGGMGLTGHILEATFQMVRVPSPWIWQETEKISDLDHFLVGLKEAAKAWPMTVGWIDSLSRGRTWGAGS